MSEIIKEKLKANSIVIIYKTNGFRYEGRILKVDDEFILMLDFKSNAERIININQIEDVKLKRMY